MGKQYIPVILYVDQNGKVTPKQIKAGCDNEWVRVDKVVKACRRASLKAGGVGIRYTCIINYNESIRDIYLFDEDGKWFIEDGEQFYE